MEIAYGQIALSSILSLLLGIFLGHRLALDRDRKKEAIAAGKEFRESFVELQRLLSLRHPNSDGNEFKNACELMPSFYKSLSGAKLKFSPFLSSSKIAKLEALWVKLWNIEGEIPFPNFSKFRTSGDHHEQLAMRDNILDVINKLIKLTI